MAFYGYFQFVTTYHNTAKEGPALYNAWGCLGRDVLCEHVVSVCVLIEAHAWSAAKKSALF